MNKDTDGEAVPTSDRLKPTAGMSPDGASYASPVCYLHELDADEQRHQRADEQTLAKDGVDQAQVNRTA